MRRDDCEELINKQTNKKLAKKKKERRKEKKDQTQNDSESSTHRLGPVACHGRDPPYVTWHQSS